MSSPFGIKSLGVLLAVLLLFARPLGAKTSGDSWTANALANKGKDKVVSVFPLRGSTYSMVAAMVHAILSQHPTLIAYPQFFFTRYDMAKLKHHFPFIEWLELQGGERAALRRIPSELKTKSPGTRYEVYLPDLSILDSFVKKERLGNFIGLIRSADKVHIYEEGSFSYTDMLPRLADWAGRNGSDPGAAAAAVVERYVRIPAGKLENDSLDGEAFFFAANTAYYLSRFPAVPKIKGLTVCHLDLLRGWNRLAEADRAVLRSFFGLDFSAVAAARKASPKPDMLILGSLAPFPRAMERMKLWIKYLVREHGGKYDLFFKPHPRDSELVAFVESHYAKEFQFIKRDIPFELFYLDGKEFDSYSIVGISTSILHLTRSRVNHYFNYYDDADPLKASFRALNLSEKVITTADLATGEKKL